MKKLILLGVLIGFVVGVGVNVNTKQSAPLFGGPNLTRNLQSDPTQSKEMDKVLSKIDKQYAINMKPTRLGSPNLDALEFRRWTDSRPEFIKP